MTETRYHHQPNTFEIHATVMHSTIDDKGYALVLDRSLFYPQGGGQPADRGFITVNQQTYTVHDVRKVAEHIHHYVNENITERLDHMPAHIRVDQKMRLLHAKYHTAGYLLAHIVADISSLKAVKGHHFPNEAYITFEGHEDNLSSLIAKAQSHAEKAIYRNASVMCTSYPVDAIDQLDYPLPASATFTTSQQTVRVCCIQGYAPVPCGGMHIHALQQLQSFAIHKHSRKKGLIKLHYKVD